MSDRERPQAPWTNGNGAADPYLGTALEGVLSETGDETRKRLGLKKDEGKPRWDLLPWAALESVSRVLEFGARKYAPGNWRHVEGWRWRYMRAAVGHLAQWQLGRGVDPESGESHLAHAACCVLFLLELDEAEARERNP